MNERSSAGTSTVPGLPAELTRLVVGDLPVHEVLRRVAREGLAHIPHASQVSVTLLDRHGRGSTVASTGDLAAALDEQQYADGFGPCVDAAQSGISVSVRDTSAPEQLYPDFAAAARRHGVTGSVSSGMTTPHVMGGINVYCTGGGPLSAETVQRTQEFADVATAAVVNAALHAKAEAEVEHLRTALDARAAIEQAKGIVMALLGCTAEEAFQQLTRTSQHADRGLRDVAADLVAAAQTGELTR